MLEGFATEGVLQELPQSAQEQIAQNVALGKPWDEGVGAAAASGALARGTMPAGSRDPGSRPKFSNQIPSHVTKKPPRERGLLGTFAVLFISEPLHTPKPPVSSS
jgi:hypothetical protein